MRTRRSILSASLSASLATPLLVVAGTGRARAQSWPTRPIRVVVASAAGGNADVVTRIIMAEMEPRLGQRIVVENMAAASGMRATEAVSRAEPDGHTWLIGTASQLVHNIALFDPLPVDITRTLRGVALLNEAPGILVVRADSPIRTVADYIRAAQAEPGRLIMGSGPAGTTTHMLGLYFAQQAAIRLEHLPYPAGAQAMRDIIGGRITSMFDISVTALPQIAGGQVRGLGVSSRERLAAAPDLPTIIEGGVADFVAGTWNSIAVPAGTPDPIVARINALVNQIVGTQAMTARLHELGTVVLAPTTPAQTEAHYAREREIWIPIVRATGARLG